MSALCILDASITLAWCFDDEKTPATEKLLNALWKQSARSTSLWLLEVSNALLVARRRGRIDAGNLAHALDFILMLDVEIDDPPRAEVIRTIVDLAEKHQLSIYDAAYLELALRNQLPLATLDGRLLAAAQAENLQLINL